MPRRPLRNHITDQIWSEGSLFLGKVGSEALGGGLEVDRQEQSHGGREGGTENKERERGREEGREGERRESGRESRNM